MPAIRRLVLSVLMALALAAGVTAQARADSVFSATDAPGGNALEDSPVEVGMKIVSSQDGYITALNAPGLGVRLRKGLTERADATMQRTE